MGIREKQLDVWTIAHAGIGNADEEDWLHTLYVTGNGRIGMRGNITQLPVGRAQEIFLAGFYDEMVVAPADVSNWTPYMHYWGNEALAHDIEQKPCIINCPDFLETAFYIDDEMVDFTSGQILSFERQLDMRAGLFTTEAEWKSPAGKQIKFTMRRFADMEMRQRIFSQFVIEPVNFSGSLSVKARINANTKHLTYPVLPGKECFYDVVAMEQIGENAGAVYVKGKLDGMEAAFASACTVASDSNAAYSVSTTETHLIITARAPLVQGNAQTIERVADIALDRLEGDTLAYVKNAVARDGAISFNSAYAASAKNWRRLWENSDIIIEGSDEDQLAARYTIYNLLIAGSRDDDKVSVPVKSLSGGGYRGAIFWDTDIYITPFYNFTQPHMARNLARFRYQTLDGAREKAAKYGNKGASYPWVTTTGEESETIWNRNITHQLHVTSDVAYALQHYVDVTGDMEFYVNCAAEVLIETARLWVSKARIEPDGSISIPQAGGPDEYHVVCDNSAYVNNMAVYNLSLAANAVACLEKNAPDVLASIRARTGLTDEEIAHFTAYQPRIKTMQDDTGLFEQCEGFFKLRDVRETNKPDEYPHETQTLRQADVLMLFYLFPGRWDKNVVQINWDYYEPRCIHASSLSHPVHGMLAAQIGIDDLADKYLRESMGMDLHNTMSNTWLGAHMATNGMNWIALVEGFGGVLLKDNVCRINPRLPKGWQRLSYTIIWRGIRFNVDIRESAVTVTNLDTAENNLPLEICGKQVNIAAGEKQSVEEGVTAENL